MALPNHIKYWINSIPLPICVLVEDISDIIDGKVIIALIKHVHKLTAVPFADTCHDWYR